MNIDRTKKYLSRTINKLKNENYISEIVIAIVTLLAAALVIYGAYDLITRLKI